MPLRVRPGPHLVRYMGWRVLAAALTALGFGRSGTPPRPLAAARVWSR
jgi:hypothetical protein